MTRKLIESQLIFSGAVFKVSRDRLLESNGNEIMREVVQHPGGAGGIPVFPDGRIALVRQYRHPAKRELLEIPAGKIDEGESPEICAAREIEEELGYRPNRILKLGEFYSTPGFCEEKLHIYLATDLIPTAQKLDHDEAVEIIYLTLAEAIALIAKGEIEDAKTIIALLWLQQNRNLIPDSSETLQN